MRSLVTSQMGLTYLWIDSLCILQNDNRDKMHEIGPMPSIYNQASVTISASRAANVRGGFLHDRLPLESFRRPYLCENGTMTFVDLTPGAKEQIVEPLSTRGWAVQERFLSSRVIEYGSTQTRWVCMYEDGTQMDGLRQSADNDSGKSDIIFRQALDIIQTGELVPRSDGHERWEEILMRYTQRILTESTDRLPAISGVAIRFSRILADEYCAALWKSALKTELLWIVDDEAELTSRPRKYQGPSWSWAAVNIPIKFQDIGDVQKSHSRIEVVGVNIQSVKSGLDRFEARFGAVESAKLIVRGLLKPAHYLTKPKGSGANMRGRQFSVITEATGLPQIGKTFWPDAIETDFENTDQKQIPVFLLAVIGSEERYAGGYFIGLVLRHVNGTEYSRLGVFKSTWMSPGDEARLEPFESQTIIIV